MSDNEMSLKALKELRQSIRALTKSTVQCTKKLSSIDKRLNKLNDQWDKGLTVFTNPE